MWRFWNSIPRILRQVHGPRASAGGVCIEEEKEIEAEITACINHGKKEQEATYCWTRTNCDQEPESHSETGGARQQDDWNWKRQYCHANIWSKFCGIQQRTLDAVTWGAAVVLGLQLSRQPFWGNFTNVVKDPDKRQQWRGLLFRMAFAMPSDSIFGGRRSIVDQSTEGQVKGFDEKNKGERRSSNAENAAAQLADDGKTLQDAVHDFMVSCQRYTAVGSTISGMVNAEAGHMTQAVEHLRLASELGHAPAYFNLALCYEMGSGVKKDLTKAAEYYNKAADMGHAQSIFNLALMHLNGDGGVAKDRSKGMELINKAAEEGLPQAHTYLGVYYTEDDENQQDFERAVSFFSAAASQDDAEGLYFLGICYENGWGVDSDDTEAAKFYAQSAKSGHDGAMYNLAAFHEYGLGGFDCDIELAMSLYEQSASQGNESAKFKMQEVEAMHAISQWEESQQDAPTSQPVSPPVSPTTVLQQNHHSSSPTLTDHVRKSIANFWAGEVSAWSSLQTLASGTTISSDGRVFFTLGDQDDVKVQGEKGEVRVGDHRQTQSCMMDLRRASTMSDFSVVPVQ